MALIFPRLARNFVCNGYFPTDEVTLERILGALDVACFRNGPSFGLTRLCGSARLGMGEWHRTADSRDSIRSDAVWRIASMHA